MEKERKIEAPYGCEIEKVELIDGVAVVTFREKERKLPKTWEEFCEMYSNFEGEYFIEPERNEKICRVESIMNGQSRTYSNAELLPDRATAEAVLALCQLIQLRNCYNGDWVPDWNNMDEKKHIIVFQDNYVFFDYEKKRCTTPLYFKNQQLRNDFYENFRDLIEKLKPLYGIKKGGKE